MCCARTRLKSVTVILQFFYSAKMRPFGLWVESPFRSLFSRIASLLWRFDIEFFFFCSRQV